MPLPTAIYHFLLHAFQLNTSVQGLKLDMHHVCHLAFPNTSFTIVLAKVIEDDGIFLLNSPSGSGRLTSLSESYVSCYLHDENTSVFQA